MNQTDVIQTILSKTPNEYKKDVENYLRITPMNEHAFEVLRMYTQVRYNQLDSYLKNVLPSTYVAWFCFMDDKDFLDDYSELVSKKLPQTVLDKLKTDRIFRDVYYTLRQKLWNY